MLARATLALTVAGTAPVAAQQFPLPDRWHQALSSPTQTFAELRIEHLDGDGRLDVLARSVPALGTPAWYATRSGASASGEFTAPALVGSGHPVGDLNGDGRTDFARVLATTVTPPLSTTFAVQLSNGAGDWLALAPQTIEWSVYSSILAKLAGADVDNDGRGDLVVYGQLLPHVYTVLGDGAGGLSNMIGHPYGAQTAVDLAAADLEGDGDTDLVLCTAAPDTVSVLRSVGPAWFLAPSVEHATSSSPTDLVLADFDVDGDVDAVFQCAPNNLLRYLAGDGAGGFAPSVDLAVPSGVLSDAIASDADDDGAPDLVVSTYVELGIFRGTPGAAPAPYQSLGPWRESELVRDADLDGDGQREWIAAQRHGVAIVEKSGPKAYAALQLPDGEFVGDWCATDLDSDGRADLALAFDGFGGVLELRSYLQQGSTYALTDSDALSGLSATSVASADFDLDGRVDVCASVYTAPSAGALALFRGLGGGAFAAGASSATTGSPLKLRSADVDGDGVADAVCLARVDLLPVLQALRGDGAGGWIPAPATTLAQQQQSIWDLQLADVDLDGALDAVLPRPGAAVAAFALARGDGVGGFLAPQSFAACPAAAQAGGALVADVDSDGRPDVLIGVQASQPSLAGVYASLGVAGHPPFAPPTQLVSDVSVGMLGAADLDRDGSIELLAMRFAAIAVFGRAGASWSLLGSATPQGMPTDWQVLAIDGAAGADVLVLSDTYAGGSQPNCFSWLPNLLALPSGLAPYGSGTPSCLGTITGVANLAPQVGESQFKLSWTNAPANAQALVGIAFAPDVAGSDVFGVGVDIHISLLGPVLAYSVASDASGAASLAFPVPNVPELAGFKAYAQALWIEPAWQSCSSSPLPWSSSTGLEVTVLP